MLNLLYLALVAYLTGASIEGVNTFAQLSHSVPELLKDTESESSQPTETSTNYLLVLLIIILVSIAGAFSWPCRLIHRSWKAYQDFDSQ